jgi:hypothetical protein
VYPSGQYASPFPRHSGDTVPPAMNGDQVSGPQTHLRTWQAPLSVSRIGFGFGAAQEWVTVAATNRKSMRRISRFL